MAESGKKRKRDVGGAAGSKKKVAIEAPSVPNAKVKVVSEGDKRAPIVGTYDPDGFCYNFESSWIAFQI